MGSLFVISWAKKSPSIELQNEITHLCASLGKFLREFCAQIPESRIPDAGFQKWKTKKVVGLYFCEDSEMRKIHLKFRKIDKTTDVLSFPTHEGAWIEGSAESLGDMVVSLDTVRRSAKRLKKPLRWELSEVLIHGVLHLLGFDHIGNKRKALRMKSLQREILSAFRIYLKNVQTPRTHRI